MLRKINADRAARGGSLTHWIAIRTWDERRRGGGLTVVLINRLTHTIQRDFEQINVGVCCAALGGMMATPRMGSAAARRMQMCHSDESEDAPACTDRGRTISSTIWQVDRNRKNECCEPCR